MSRFLPSQEIDEDDEVTTIVFPPRTIPKIHSQVSAPFLICEAPRMFNNYWS